MRNKTGYKAGFITAGVALAGASIVITAYGWWGNPKYVALMLFQASLCGVVGFAMMREWDVPDPRGDDK